MCLHNGGTEHHCAATMEEMLLACIENCEPPDCEQTCQRHADEALNVCLEAGGSQEECAAKAELLTQGCMQRCNHPGRGDLDARNGTNHGDFAILALAWHTTPGDARWNPACDISIPYDDLIDLRDLIILGQDWLSDAK